MQRSCANYSNLNAVVPTTGKCGRPNRKSHRVEPTTAKQR